MKRSTLFFLVYFSLFFCDISAQDHKPDSQVCKTPSFHPSAMKSLVQKAGLQSRSPSTLYIPVTINLVGTDQGHGFYPPSKVLDALCQLNEDFQPYDFHFYVEGDYQYYNSSEFYEMSSNYAFSEDMDQFIIDHNTDNTLNIYIVEKTQSNGGGSFAHWPLHDTLVIEVPWATNFPQDHAVVMRKQHLDEEVPHIFAHEVGHFFSLWHTYFAWEGLVYNTTNYPTTPEYLSFDWAWQDSLYNFQVMVERADGLDCENSGDFICDTPPDYLSFAWVCNGNMESQIQYDPTGAEFRSDGTNFMSHSNNECRNQFSEGQVDIMRYYAEETRNYLLYNQIPADSLSVENLNLIFPSNEGVASPINDSITLEWEMQGADHYLLTYGFINNGIYIPVKSNVFVADNQFKINIINPNTEQFWIVRAVSNYYPCAVWADTSYFHLDVVDTDEIRLTDSLKIFPNPASGKIQITGVAFQGVKIINQLGQIILCQRDPVAEIDISGLSPGIYFIQVNTEHGLLTKKLMKT